MRDGRQDESAPPAVTAGVGDREQRARRTFLERMAGTAGVLVAAPVLTALHRASPAFRGAPDARQRPQPRGPWSDAWLQKLTGRHKQFFDAPDANDGFALAFAMHYLDLNHEVYGLSDNEMTAVIGLRHLAMPFALPDALWERYAIGEDLQIKDPATGGPATRNPYLHADAAPASGADIPTLVHRGVLFTVCNVALTMLSARMAKHAGLSREAARGEWASNLLPGMTLVPVGVMAVNQAQEHGCSYCYGG